LVINEALKKLTGLFFILHSTKMSEERFWNNLDRTEGENKCWVWKLSCNSEGYGNACFKGKRIKAHRLAFELFHKRKIIEGMFILHSCDNCKCCNPFHLREGTPKENMNDKVLRNRQPRGETSGCSKLTEVQVLEIRNKYAESNWTYTRLGTEYGVGQSTISYIINRKRWTHI